jgi:hypothetical protein
MLKASLFRQKNKPVPQPQNGKRRAIPQPQILTKLLGNRKLPLLANLGCGQVFEGGIVSTRVAFGSWLRFFSA